MTILVNATCDFDFTPLTWHTILFIKLNSENVEISAIYGRCLHVPPPTAACCVCDESLL